MLLKLLTITLALSSVSAFADLKSDLLAKNDQDMWRAGRSGGIGKCYIARSVGNGNFCDYYLKTSKWGASQPYNALPLKNGLPYGSGCLVASSASMMNPALPSDIIEAQSKNVTNCWGAPNTYPNWNATSTPICTGDHVKNAANMLRNAVTDAVDPCDLASVAPSSNQAADTASELLDSGKIKFADITAGGMASDCWRMNAGAPVMPGLYPAVKLSKKACMKLRNRKLAKHGPNAFFPTVDVSQWMQFALGQLTSVQILDIFRNLYMTLNSAVLNQLDQKNLVNVSTMTAAELTAHEAALAALAAQLHEPTDTQKEAALTAALGNGP